MTAYSLQRDAQGRYYILDYNVPLDTPPIVHSVYPDRISACQEYRNLHGYGHDYTAARKYARIVDVHLLDDRYFSEDGRILS